MASVKPDPSSKDIAVVIGASGGIGSALRASLEQSGRFGTVVGLSRRSDPSLDVEDETTIRQAAEKVAETGAPTLVINAVGLLHAEGVQPEKSWRSLDAEVLSRLFAVNAVGPALVMKHFLPLLPRDRRSVLAHISAKVGSIGDNRLGGWYGYRASKAALNQFVRTAAVELARVNGEAVCVAIHPGTVDTALSKPFAKTGLGLQTPDQAATAILAALGRLTPADSGNFFDRSGTRLPF